MDNVFVERLWRSLKYEEVYLKAYDSIEAARENIAAWIQFYNFECPHQALGYKTPWEVFRNKVEPEAALRIHMHSAHSQQRRHDSTSLRSAKMQWRRNLQARLNAAMRTEINFQISCSGQLWAYSLQNNWMKQFTHHSIEPGGGLE